MHILFNYSLINDCTCFLYINTLFKLFCMDVLLFPIYSKASDYSRSYDERNIFLIDLIKPSYLAIKMWMRRQYLKICSLSKCLSHCIQIIKNIYYILQLNLHVHHLHLIEEAAIRLTAWEAHKW